MRPQDSLRSQLREAQLEVQRTDPENYAAEDAIIDVRQELDDAPIALRAVV
jgi:hypothetical protein